jgi:hypothetical protein
VSPQGLWLIKVFKNGERKSYGSKGHLHLSFCDLKECFGEPIYLSIKPAAYGTDERGKFHGMLPLRAWYLYSEKQNECFGR